MFSATGSAVLNHSTQIERANFLNLLIVDDDRAIREACREVAQSLGFNTQIAESAEQAFRVLESSGTDAVLLDLRLPGTGGLEALHAIKKHRADALVIVVTGYGTVKSAVQAMKDGAYDYVTKPFSMEELRLLLERVAGHLRLKTENRVLRETIKSRQGFGNIIGRAPDMEKLYRIIAKAGQSSHPVLILGESGTGKEVLARLIHKLSPRAHRTFLKVNCAAVPADLLESELFGYEAGAFTGATHPKPGKFELCNKGTILLDEIGEMPPLLQAKLLHVLQDQTFSRLGSRTVIKVDVRILAATNIDIPEALATKRLREDLYYRLNAFTLSLPPLRERKEEIPILLKHFMSRMSESYARPPLPLSPPLMEACLRHAWPGNLRELSNFIKRYLVLGDETLAASELQPRPDGGGGAHSEGVTRSSGNSGGGLKSLSRNAKDEAEAEAIARALEDTNWNRKQAAAQLKISYKALLYKIRQYGIAQSRSTHRLSAGA